MSQDTAKLLLTINNPSPESNDHFGGSVAVTPTGDLLVGAYYNNDGDPYAGCAYLFDGTLRGTTNTPLLTINNPSPESQDYFGYSVAATPTGDLLVGANGDNTGAGTTGSAYLFDGTLRGTTNTPLLTINNPSPESYDNFGNSVATTPTGDLLVGAPGDNTGASGAGCAYLFDGTLRGTTNTPLLTINNPSPELYDNFGYSVATTPTGDLLVDAYQDNTGASGAGSAYLFEGVYSPPIITSLVLDDPDGVYSIDDTITITFNSDTNMPGGTYVQRKPAVDDMFTFTESLGRAYSGKWISHDIFFITIHSVNDAGPPVVGITTVTPTGTTPILSANGKSEPSSAKSPVMSGNPV